MSNTITVFTDGSSRGNPGPGGWGAVLVFDIKAGSSIVELGGREDYTTNNRMEMTAGLNALRKIDSTNVREAVITINTDSSYLINGITKWVHGWRRNNWITSQKKDVENRDLWEELVSAVESLGHSNRITWNYVGGHIGIAGNERCDEIATAFADKTNVDLYNGPISGYRIKNILDVSHSEDLSQSKKSSSSRSKAKAYSYVSGIAGEVRVHSTWAECERRVKGVKGARFRKALSKEEEASIMREFSK